MSTIPRPSLNAIRAFEAAARLGGFKAAADELHVTPSAVSHQVANLEREIGVSLFHRRGRHISLSAPGELYWRRVHDALSTLMHAADGIADAAGQSVLSVVAASSFAAKWLMPRLDRFLRDYVDIRVRVEPADNLQHLGDADVGIFYGNPAGRNLVARQVINERVLVLCAPGLKDGEPPLDTPGDLARHVLIHARNHLSWPDWLMQKGLGDLAAGRELFVERSTLAIDAAVRGVGVILESDLLAADEIRDGRLVEPFDARFRLPPTPAYYVVTSDRVQVDGPALAFTDWLARETGTT